MINVMCINSFSDSICSTLQIGTQISIKWMKQQSKNVLAVHSSGESVLWLYTFYKRDKQVAIHQVYEYIHVTVPSKHMQVTCIRQHLHDAVFTGKRQFLTRQDVHFHIPNGIQCGLPANLTSFVSDKLSGQFKNRHMLLIQTN